MYKSYICKCECLRQYRFRTEHGCRIKPWSVLKFPSSSSFLQTSITSQTPPPPTLSLIVTSHASRPLTICIPHGSPLDPKGAMGQGGFPIYDLTTSPPKPLAMNDLSGRINRAPTPNKLLSLSLGEPKTLGVAFTRGGSYEPAFRPQPWEIVRRGRVLDQDGKELNIRRPTKVGGVDGLEPGKRYRATVAMGKLMCVTGWWNAVGDEGQSGDNERDKPQTTLVDFEIEGGGVEFSVEE